MKHTFKRVLAILISIMIAMPGTVFADDDLITDVVIGEGSIAFGDEIVIEGDPMGPEGLAIGGDLEAGNGLDLNSLLVSNEPQGPEAAAFEQSAALDGVAFTVTASAGVFPAGAELRVTGVDAEVAQAAIQSIEATLGGEATHHLYQIQVLDAAGNPLSPNAGTELPLVRVEGLALDDGARVFVYDQTLAGSYEIAVDGAFSFHESGIYDIVEERPSEGGENTTEQPETKPEGQPEEKQPEQQPEEQQPEEQQPEEQRPEEQQPQEQQPEEQQPEEQQQLPEEQLPVEQQPEEKQPEEELPEEQQPEEQQPEAQQPEEQHPEEQQPEEQQPEGQQPEEEHPASPQKPSPDGEGGAAQGAATDEVLPEDTPTAGEAEETPTSSDPSDADPASPKGESSEEQPEEQHPEEEQPEAQHPEEQHPEEQQPEQQQPEAQQPEEQLPEQQLPEEEPPAAPQKPSPDGEGGAAQGAATDEVLLPDDAPTAGETEEALISSDPADGEPTSEDPLAGEDDLVAPQPVAVFFNTTPAEAAVTVCTIPTEETISETVPAQADGSFALLPGDYAYTASAEGYISIENVPFTVEAGDIPQFIDVALAAEAAPEPVPFDQSVTVDGVTVRVRAEAGAFPNGAALSVSAVEAQSDVDAAVEAEREDGVNVAASYTFDIKVVDPETGAELQPAAGFCVSVSFTAREVASRNLETQVYHVSEDAQSDALVAEPLDVTEAGRTATAETDGFSYYQVEFTYEKKQYVLPGDGTVSLSKVLSAVGLYGAVTGVEVSNPDLFAARRDESGKWVVSALKPFSSEEWMKVTISSVAYEIAVTDNQQAQQSVSYVNAQGVGQEPQLCTIVTAGDTSWNTGWYAVADTTTIENRLTVSGTVNLILCDGKTLTATKGITVSEGDSLTVWGQRAGTGMLYAGMTKDGDITCEGACAGIGGAWGHDGGNITITGGTVKATGSSGSAGIGGGSEGAGGIIIISAGTVNATGGENGAGIGSGENGTGGTINIMGGTVTATGSSGGAGIGGGQSGAGGTIEIIGGTVNATSSEGGAGIGCGNGGAVGTITVSGGNVKASGGERGLGFDSGLTLTWTNATKQTMRVWANAFPTDDVNLSADFRTEDNIQISSGRWCLRDYNGKVIYPANKDMSGLTFVDYVDAKGNPMVKELCTVVTTGATAWGTENQTTWYAVTGDDVTINSRVTAFGNVNLILCDGKTLTAMQGITVSEGNSLTIWRQTVGTGKLVAGVSGSVASDFAGIGGNNDHLKKSGTITVNGGEVTATGGSAGAGIGGGRGGTGGNITVNGGEVTATGGSNCAGIGDGKEGTGCTITVNGGEITAIGGDCGAGIGGGYNGAGGDITVSGGEVTATGGTGGAGIGGGYNGAGGDITVSGGEVMATGGKNGAGIGGGQGGTGGTINITGGKVTATGGESGAGIGGGWNGAGVTINITGGEVTATGGESGAGIGGGNGGTGGNITVNGGKVTANGSNGGAGIGGGQGGGGTGGNITVNGGEITAIGGTDHVGRSGAGIGGGYNGAGGTITVNGGEVTATGKSGSAGIGDGKDYEGSDHAVIVLTYADVAEYPIVLATNDSASQKLGYSGNVKLGRDFCIKNTGGSPGVVFAATGDAVVDESLLPHMADVTLAPCTAYAVTPVLNPSAASHTVKATVDGIPVTKAVAGSTVKLNIAKNAGAANSDYSIRDVIKEGGTDSETINRNSFTEATFTMPAGNVTATYTKWAKLQALIDDAAVTGSELKLGEDYTAVEGDKALDVPEDKSVSIDLNGHTVNRGLTAVQPNGNVITVYGSLTVTDTSTNKAGKITGGNTTDNGGGVYVNTDGTFTMSGGSVTGNTAGYGGGVYVNTDGTFTMSGGSVTGNTANSFGGGVYVNAGTFKLSGAPVITDNRKGATVDNGALAGGVAQNVFLPSGKTVTVEGPLTEDASIGVTAEAKPEDAGLVPITNGLQGNGQLSAFISDEEYTVGWNGAGTEAMLGRVIAATGTGYSGDYDGNAHGITVNVTTPASGATVKFGESEDACDKDKLEYSEAGTYTVCYQVTAKGYFPVTGSAKVEIKPITATVTITGATNTADYDGQAHTASGYTVSDTTGLYKASDLAFTGTATASRTDAGKTPMGLAASQFTNKSANFTNVTFSVTNGWQEVMPITATVTVTGATNSADYDGKAHTVSGYTATASTALYDVTKDFAFSGTASASRTDAGKTGMGLAASQFANKSENFTNVTFSVTDGWQEVKPITATVTVTGVTNTADYDGKAHRVSGYTATASTALYDVTKDFTFTGTATAAQKDAGKAAMGLAASQFKNTNANFTDVAFNVTDGWQEVTPAAITITADDKASQYGKAIQALTYAVGGDYVAGDDLGVTLSTKATKQSNAGRYPITVAWNGNPNYTAELVDGVYTVTKGDLPVTARGYSGTYDGKAHGITVNVGKSGATVYYSTGKLTAKNYKTEGRKTSPTLKKVGKTRVYYYAVGRNYEAVSGSKVVEVKAKPLTVRARAVSKLQGKRDPALAYTVSGLVKGETADKVLTGALARQKGEAPGKYKIRQGSLRANGNYKLTFKTAVFTIKPYTPNPNATLLLEMTSKGNTATLTWTEIPGAQGYDVFFKKCQDKNDYLLAQGVKGLSCTIEDIEKGIPYKAFVRAWKKKDREKVYIGKRSPIVHCIGGGYNDQYCNPKSVNITGRNEIRLGVSGKKAIHATITGVRADRELLRHAKLLRYYSTDRKVARVNARGVVKGIGKGECEIIVMSNNGVRSTVTVIVK